MKKNILSAITVITIILLLVSCVNNVTEDISNDQELYRIVKRGKWGFINQDGEVVIKPDIDGR